MFKTLKKQMLLLPPTPMYDIVSARDILFLQYPSLWAHPARFQTKH